ncbi:DUF4190 domain-containing protein [Terrabacter sp. GCM10028922]|uniref:DUF4190 domain-containing protein n=1 Tax=Terrabacter sp. GCM10028922 TaxID=3273428 RepID=UPI0036209156
MTDEMPRPSGPQQAGPVPPGPVPPGPVPPGPVPPGPMMPGPVSSGPVSSGPMLPAPMLSYERTPMPGANGLAIAALCCGLVGLFPIAAVVAVVLGIVALSQLQRRIQRGRGMAIAGIVLGSLWIVLWIVFVVAAVNDAPERDVSGAVAQQSEVFVDDLKAGDCFSGGKGDDVDLVTAIPCASPHESQVVTTFELPDGAYPGEDAVIDAAEQGCVDKGDPLLTDKAFDELEPTFIYPDSYTWRGDRSIICVVEAPSGTTTGTALK